MTLVDDLVQAVADLFGVHENWIRAWATLVLGVIAGYLAYRVVRTMLVPAIKRGRPDEPLVGQFALPVGLTFAFFGLLSAGQFVLAPEVLAVLPRAGLSGILVIWGVFIARLTGRLFIKVSHRARPGFRGAEMAARLVKVGMGTIVLLSLLVIWDVSITPLLASAGIAGIALAFAAQESIANLFAGVAIYVDELYEPGDFVVLDPGSGVSSLRGEVADVGLRSTRIRTRDDVIVVVPNSLIANSILVNESRPNGQMRLVVRVDVAYATDLSHAERILIEVAKRHDRVLALPEPCGRVRAFGESGVSMECLAWIANPVDKGVVSHELSMVIHKRFREEGITIPFPQRDVHLIPPVQDADVEK